VVPVIFTGSAYDVIDVNECFHDFMFVNRAHPRPLLRFGKFSSTARCKDLKSLYCTIRRLFADYSFYSPTIRTIRRLFADYSYYSSPIRGLFVLFVDYSLLFADYSYYSSTIRTIRFTILVLPIARSEQNRTEQEVRKLKQEVSKI
jgi:hypothetical protein